MKAFLHEALIGFGLALVVVLTMTSAEARDVSLAWDCSGFPAACEPVDDYVIYRAEFDGVNWSAWAPVGTALQPSFVDLGVSDAGVFAWYVSARYAGAESGPSNIVLDSGIGVIIPPPPAPVGARFQ